MNEKEFVLSVLEGARGDDLYRARAAFRGWPAEKMDRVYGQSDKTPREIIAGYEERERQVDRAIAWVKEVEYTVQPVEVCGNLSPRWADPCVLPKGHEGDHSSKWGTWTIGTNPTRSSAVLPEQPALPDDPEG